MKIIYLHQYFNTPEMKGGIRSYEIAKCMIAKGHEVHMVTSSTNELLKAKRGTAEDIDGIQVHWLKAKYNNSMGVFRRLIAFFEFALKAGKLASSLDGDIVYATSTPLTIALPAVLASRKLGIPMVFEVRDLWPDIPIAMGALNFPFAKLLAKKLELWAYFNSKHVVALSPGMCKGISRTGFPKEKISCIPNFANSAFFDGAEFSGKEFREKREWLKQNPLVLYAGAFGRVNGLEYMVRLAREMLNVNPEIRFLAVGKGAETRKIFNLAKQLDVLNKNFFIENPVPKREIPTLFSAATICASWVIDNCVLWNNSANKFFDAIAAGKPIVINYGGWQKELIESESLGLSLPAKDILSAARLLDTYIKNPESLERARQSALTLSKTRFCRDRLASELIEILESVVCRDKQTKS